MGHERIGFLPRTKSWRNIVNDLESATSGSDGDFAALAVKTLEQVRERFLALHRDAGVQAALGFIVAIARSKAITDDSRAAPAIEVPSNLAPLRLSIELNNWVDVHAQSQEYAEIAKRAAAETLTVWHSEQIRQGSLFASEPSEISRDAWANASTGAGFSEISRLFFARFTERYLRYFLEREASAAIGSFKAREKFSERLHLSMESVSKHAFETSKIAQSFAAGWFNKYARDQTPKNAKLSSFLRVAFNKLSEELRREAS